MTLFLTMAFKGFLMSLYTLITGKEMFPANPKGPLYKWFGKANHASSPQQPQRRVQSSEQPLKLPSPPRELR